MPLQAKIAEAATRLLTAASTRHPCAPIRDLIGATDIAAAYAIQQTVNSRRLESTTRTGRKIGLTSPAVQKQIGVDSPDFGVLFHDAAFVSGTSPARVPMTRLMQPRVEAEVAFILKHTLDGTITFDSVRAAVAYAVPALEVVDSRIAAWDIRLSDTVADNASFGAYILGTDRRTLDEFTPADVVMAMTVDGVEKSSGRGVDCLGDPLNAVLWLARTAKELGDPLREGEVVLSGALGAMVAVKGGSLVEAEIGGLGRVRAVFE
jgi:2-keto-4-pentenoate hydratase